MHPPPAARPKRLAFEAARGLAALAIFFFHANHMVMAWTSGATAEMLRAGVPVFFVLSGFLLARAVVDPEHFDRMDYVNRRCRRILPGYFAILFLLLGFNNARALFEPGAAWNILTHLGLLHGWFDVWDRSIGQHLWTISHEWSFYLLLLVLAPWARSRRAGWTLPAAMIIVAVAARWGARKGFAFTLFHPLCHYDEFACGMLACAACHSAKTRAWLSANRLHSGTVILAGLAACSATISLWHKAAVLIHAFPLYKFSPAFDHAVLRKPSLTLWAPLLFASGTAAILAALWARPATCDRWLARSPLPWMGKVSYSTYLIHIPILRTFAEAAEHHPDAALARPLPLLLVSLVLVYGGSYVFHKLVEAPWLGNPASMPGTRQKQPV